MNERQDLRIATRTSPLALWQARTVKRKLESIGIRSVLIETQTTGDVILDKPLYDIGGKGLFIKELEKLLLEDRADIAVHSLKDLPAKLGEPFELGAVLEKEHSEDLIILKKDHSAYQRFSSGHSLTIDEFRELNLSTIATGSLRRKYYCLNAVNSINIEPLRGNIQTRLDKLSESTWDGIIMAEAAYERLNLGGQYPCLKLSPDWFVPSACQGVVGIEHLKDSKFKQLISKINCAKSKISVDIEREILATVSASCTTPIGCHVLANPRGDSYDVSIRILAHKNCSLDVELFETKPENITELFLKKAKQHPERLQIQEKLGLRL